MFSQDVFDSGNGKLAAACMSNRPADLLDHGKSLFFNLHTISSMINPAMF
jgi:hypothetical protein